MNKNIKKTLLILTGFSSVVLPFAIALSFKTNYQKITMPSISNKTTFNKEFNIKLSDYQLTKFSGYISGGENYLINTLVPTFTYKTKDQNDVIKKASITYTQHRAIGYNNGYWFAYNDANNEWLGADVKLNKLWDYNYHENPTKLKSYWYSVDWNKKNLDDGSFAKHDFSNISWSIDNKKELENWIDNLDIKLKNVTDIYRSNDEQYISETKNSYFYSNPSILKNIKSEIKNNIIKKYNDEIHNKHNTGDFRIKNLKIKNLKLEVKFKMDFGKTTRVETSGGECYGYYSSYCEPSVTKEVTITDTLLLGDKITEFKVKVNFNFEYEYENVANKNYAQKLDDYLHKIKSQFNNSFAKTNNTIKSLSDVYPTDGLYTKANKSLNLKNTQAFFDLKITKWTEKNILNKYQEKIVYNVKNSNDKKNSIVDFYLEFKNNLSQKKEYFTLALNVKINFELTDKAKKLSLKNRIIVKPSKYLDLTNVYNGQLVDDKPKEIIKGHPSKNIDNVLVEYGGEWEYNSLATVMFNTQKQENEILFINGQKVDVLDRYFQYNLEDLRSDAKDDNTNSNQAKNANKYRVEVVQYDKKNINAENIKPIQKYYIDIVINSVNPKLEAQWFAWDPDNNPKQKSIITEFLIDKSTNDFVRDNNGEKIKNPDYDPLVDRKTGTKKQLVWVDFENQNNKLPNDTRFLQDPLGIEKKLIPVSQYKWGFIAEASLVGKGAKLTLEKADNQKTKRFKINSKNINEVELIDDNENDTDTLKEGNIIQLSQEEKNYFSSSGIWLFSSRTEKGIDSYKIVAIGDNNPKNLFTEQFVNQKISSFWTSLPGIHLFNFLNIEKKMTKEQINTLIYENVINYWKEYVSFNYQNNKALDTIFYIKPLVKIQELRNYAKSQTKNNFINNLKTLNKFLADFQYKELVDSNITIDEKNNLKFVFSIKDDTRSLNYQIDKSAKEIIISDLKFKDEEKDYETKIAIHPIVDVEKIKLFAKNTTKANFLTSTLWYKWYLNFDNSDKLISNIEYNEETFEEHFNIIINYKLLEKYKNEYYLNKNVFKIYLTFDELKTLNDTNLNQNKTKNINETNTSKLQDIFNDLKIDEINLKAIKKQKQAENYIIETIEKNMDSKFKYNDHWKITNLSDAVKKAISKVYKFKDAEYKEYYLNLEVIQNNENLIGKKTIVLVNLVDNLEVPSEQNLATLKLKTIKANISNKDKLKAKIIEDLNKQLKNYNLNFEQYLIIENWDKILELLTTENQINKIKAIVKPKNFIMYNSAELNIINNMLKADDSTYDPYSDPGLENDAIEKIVKNNKNQAISKNINKSIDKKKLMWIIPLAIVLTILTFGIVIWIYYRFGPGKKIKK
ncbi:Mbov_0399 family ICE element protein [Mesomycoplasma neurolyticum]|uniref:Uncharacterized protein n=2 Tax=Mesomycoplasma neurolyticum TaxID=2120 RepID=A0A449A5S3_9BACT|nr:hypothetical protein [Mesomycoplasma neurolyticum]VEU59605.1 Uncharacterised protein [Mesomycoplasma neurolyticum]